MLIEHPKIYLDAAGTRTDALLFSNGTIRATGDEARRLADGHRPYRPEGECLFPALADAHIHLWGMGQRAGTIHLDDTQSAADVYRHLRAADHDEGFTDWIIGHGFNDHYWDAEARLTRDHLDEMYPNRPVCLFRSALHAAMVNSEALRRANIDETFNPGRGGRAERDAAGRLTGLLVDEALAPVHDAIPPPTEDENFHVLSRCARMLRRHGISSAHMAKMNPAEIPFLRRLRDDGELPVRIFAMIDGADLDYDDPGFEPFHDPDARASWATIKFFTDGALGSLGGLLIDTYHDGTKGLELYTAEEFQRIFPRLTRQGFQLAVHAIGDRAAQHVLEGLDACPPDELQRTRPRLEHSQMMTSQDIERLPGLSTIASIQPIHLHDDCVWAHEVLEPFQLDRLYDFDRLAAHTRLAGGSDYPVADANPWHGISVAMTRQTRTGDTFFPGKNLDRETILHAYTSGAAYAAHWEEKLGTLHPGFVADIISLDRDPFLATPDEIWGTEVMEMWIGGERVDGEA